MRADPSLRRHAGKRTARILALAVVLGLAGCVRYEPKPISATKNADALGSRSLNDPGLRTFIETNRRAALPSWPLGEWSLSDLTTAAFYFHPDLDEARATWSVAEAGRISARQRPNPTLAIAPGYNTTMGESSAWFATITLDVPIETAGKRGDRTARAEHLTESARMNILSTAWLVRSRLRKAWVDVHAAGQSEKLLRRQQETQAQLVRLMEVQSDAGAISAFEVTQARMALNHSRLAWQEAQGRRSEAEARLAAAAGVPLDALRGVHLSFQDLDQTPADLPSETVRRQALLNRADLLGALADYAASESALKLEIAKQYPDIHLAPGYKYDQGEDKWSLGLAFPLPILNRNQGPIAEADARRAEAEARFNVLQAGVIAEVERALAAYRAALASVSTADAMAADLAKQSRAARAQFEAGNTSRVELSVVQVELDNLALVRLNAWARAQQAFGDLEAALQIPETMDRTELTNSPQPSLATTHEDRNE